MGSLVRVDAPTPLYDGAAHSVAGAHQPERARKLGEWLLGPQETVATVTGPLSVLVLKSVAADTGGAGALRLTTEESWGNPATLEDHFLDHGADFGAANADEYASQASQFLQDGLADGLPTKIDTDGIIRVYDPATNTFGAYNADGHEDVLQTIEFHLLGSATRFRPCELT